MQYLEKAMEVLSGLENANINPLFSHPCPSPPLPTQKSYPLPPWLRQKAKDRKLDLLQKKSTLRYHLQMTAYLSNHPFQDPYHAN